MTPTLLFPLGLAALASILIPLVLHLARRTEQRPTNFAALRWLRQKPRPRHRPKFDELLLLATRILLLALVSVFLAGPALLNTQDPTPVIALAPGIDVTTVTRDAKARAIWLAPGFPPIDTPAPRGAVPIGSLIRQLDLQTAATAPLTIVVPATLDGADAEHPRVSHRVRWRVVPGAMAASRPAASPLRVALRTDAAHAPGSRYIRAATAALGLAIDVGDTARAIPPRTTALIWLAGGTLPAPAARWIDRGGTALVASDTVIAASPTVPAWHDETGRPLAETRSQGNGHVARLLQPLDPIAMPALVEPSFPKTLADLLAPGSPPTRVEASAYRPLPGGLPPASQSRDLRPWFALAIAVAWLVERWLATRAKRAIAP
ncbi:BatA domain-containing protein [Sphingomonas faeni]|uniref:BatA domain-containing protein n=1 Tax=Sphingomonas faeni TaxID=185950 RepID=UPI003357A533